MRLSLGGETADPDENGWLRGLTLSRASASRAYA